MFCIQYNTDSCCNHIISGVNIYLCGWVSLLIPACGVSLFVRVCDFKSRYKSKTILCVRPQ